ncbi:PREDICTED: serine/threonine-protein kinase mos [Nicrophorus vespilloides]|uniref:non-specific serine/threonine protein kinase n=1 Tax=Nicrophorus vespilloides TaxID=110193 RepID=A0ABM1NCQ0_NICVS|nr:PREDICTED: serine/threonine-protein kinase mos [Nicrophorus vespilloides]
MATPIKCLAVSPRIVRGLSPNVKRSLVGRLDYSPKPKRENIQCRITINGRNYADEQDSSSNKRLLVINTPKKLSILRDGLSDCKKLKVLGRGSFGTVVKGIHKDKIVAVKVIKTKEKLKELNALGLKHKNVISIFDVITESDSNSIVIMEYLDNCRQLQAVLDDERAIIDVCRIALDVASGLKFCHDSDLMHLDLKPKNVLLTATGSCKICDFGNSCDRNDKDNYTHEGTVIYTAPEILAGGKPDFPADVYSLGVLFWQLKHREIPFKDFHNKFVVIYKVVKYRLRPSENPDAHPSDYDNLYRSCWKSEPSQRPSTKEIIETLETIIPSNSC